MQTVRVERWPTELPLLALVATAAAALWVVLVITIFGIIYAALIGVVLFVSHLAFVAYLRGSAVRLGPDQFPELYQRVVELSARVGLKEVPEAYLMQAGGALNALATAFLRSKLIVLFADLLEACGDDEAARDMIVGHELGHHRAGHLRLQWLLFPGLLVPFLGSAYSRAREYTCDRYGVALCGDRRGALRGLAILAAGGTHGRRVNLEALARQRSHLDTGWMTLGKWLGPHPPLCERLAALEPTLAMGARVSPRGPVRAVGILGLGVIVPAIALGVLSIRFIRAIQREVQATHAASGAAAHTPPADLEAARKRAREQMANLVLVAETFRAQNGRLPANEHELYRTWEMLSHGEEEPQDPFDGLRYGYTVKDDAFTVWSSGPDGVPGTQDDLELEPVDRPQGSESGSPPGE